MEQVPARGEERRFKATTHSLLWVLIATLLAGTGCGGLFPSSSSGRGNHKSLSSLVISPANPVVPIGDSERFVVTGRTSQTQSRGALTIPLSLRLTAQGWQ
jgi:hypothetical protein